ncbi:MAG: hypothetical protein WDN10_04760 [bacterium]
MKTSYPADPFGPRAYELMAAHSEAVAAATKRMHANPSAADRELVENALPLGKYLDVKAVVNGWKTRHFLDITAIGWFPFPLREWQPMAVATVGSPFGGSSMILVLPLFEPVGLMNAIQLDNGGGDPWRGPRLLLDDGTPQRHRQVMELYEMIKP